MTGRLAWAGRVKKCTWKYLRRWVYTDGASFYLDRDAADVESSGRACLGKFVYRMEETTDSLYKDCVGPSSYRKSQGERVAIWGMLIDGKLHITVLEKGTTMNRWEYAWIVRHRFKHWLGKRKDRLLVQDHEGCLWSNESIEAMQQIGLKVIDWHPTYSPDLNAIENAWSFLRCRLEQTHPTSEERERRSAFISRLRSAVAWVNKHHKSGMRSLCFNQKARAADVELQEGYRTGW